MRWLSRIIAILLLILFVLAFTAFLVSNGQPHRLMFLDWALFELAVGVWVLIALALGFCLGGLVFMPKIMNLRRQNRRMQKKILDQSEMVS